MFEGGNRLSKTELTNATGQKAAGSSNRWKYMLWAAAILLIAIVIYLATLSLSAGAADSATTLHDRPGMQIEWSIEQYPAVVLQPNPFVLVLRDDFGEPLTDSVINVKLEMLNMLCGDYLFDMQETSPGQYEGDGMPLMAGLWRATAVIEPANGDPFTISRTLKAVY
jgi:hypothetical protein